MESGDQPERTPGRQFWDHGPEDRSSLEEVGGGRRIHRRFHRAQAPGSLDRLAATRQGHPRCVAPEAVHEEDGWVHLIRPFIPGQSLAQRLEGGPIGAREAIAVAQAALAALQGTDGQHMLHGGLKPGNIILGVGDEDVHLVDFGVCEVRAGMAADRLDPASGWYMAPEQTGLIDYPVGPWSDIYSLGVILYEAMSGVHLFKGNDMGSVLRLHMTRNPPALRSQGVRVARIIDDIVARMLAKDPRDRYHSCEGVQADLLAATAFMAGDATPVVIGQSDIRHTLATPAFVARDADLAALREALSEARQGKPGLAFIEAPSGVGKSRLLEELERDSADSDTLVIHGQAYDQIAPRPYAILDGLATAVRNAEDRPDALAHYLGEDLDVVARALPGLGHALGASPGADEGPEEYGEGRTRRALRRLMDSLGRLDGHVLLVLDDLQWADGASRRLLEDWWQHCEDGQHLMVAVAFRQDHVGKQDRLRRLKPSVHVRLEPLQESQVASMVRSMTGPIPEPVQQRVADLAEGNPFMVTAVLHGLVEAGAMVAGPDGWTLQADALAALDHVANIEGLLMERFQQLSEPAKDVLHLGAVCGKKFEVPTVAALSQYAKDAVGAALLEAQRRHILVRTGPADELAFSHDQLREAILRSMSDEERATAHARAAQHLQVQTEKNYFELAYHFHAAGTPSRALPYALEAAQTARKQFALGTAHRYYRIALDALATDAPEQCQVHQGLGETLMLQGRYKEAEPWLTKAAALARTRQDRASLQGRLGDLEFKRGNLPQAAAALEAALRSLGHPVPSSRTGMLLRLPWQLTIHLIHQAWPATQGRGQAERKDRDLLAARLYSSLAHVYWFLRGVAPTAWAHLQEMNRAERYGPSDEVAQAYAEHTVIMSTVPMHARGRRFAARALRIRRDLRSTWGEGQALHFSGLGRLAAGDLQEALVELEEATRIFDRTGDLWQAGNAAYHVALLHVRMGDLEAGTEAARKAWERADSLGDAPNAALAMEAWAKAGGTGLTAKMVKDEMARCPDYDVQGREAVLQAAGMMALQRGEPSEAGQHFRQAWRVAKQGGLRSEYVAPIPCWIVTCERLCAEATDPWQTGDRKAHLATARKWLRRAKGQAKKYPNNRPHVLREEGLLAALAGHHEQARHHLDQSIEEAHQREMRREELASAREVARLGRSLEWDVTPADGVDDAAYHEPPAEIQVAFADRYETLLAIGRRLAAAHRIEEVEQCIQDAGVSLLHGDEVLFIRPQELGDAPAPVRGFIRSSDAAGRVVTFSADAVSSDSEKALARAGHRSAILIPITHEGARDGWLVVLHSQVAGLFGDADRGLAEFLAGLAAAAMARARQYSELMETHDRLRFQAGLLQNQAESMTQGLLVVDQDGKIVSYNQRFLQMWNIPEEVAEKGSDHEAIAYVTDQLEDPGEFERRIQALYEHPTDEAEEEIRLRDGRIFERFTGPVLDPEGHPKARAWYFRDVTAQRMYEEDLRHANERLQELDEMRTRFINSAAHELNTPLTPILLQLRVLERLAGELDDRGQRSLSSLGRNLRRFKRLVADVLDVARIESGALRLNVEPIDLCSSVRHAIESFGGACKREGITIERDLPEEAPIHADSQRIDQVLFNLISNAVRYTPKGGKIRIQVTNRADLATVTVADAGPGLSKEQLGELFRPFSQPVEAPDGKVGGTGLGLVICEGIVKQHGGSIWARSDGPGQGARFTFQLPKDAQAR